jgi:hypothetical protein
MLPRQPSNVPMIEPTIWPAISATRTLAWHSVKIRRRSSISSQFSCIHHGTQEKPVKKSDISQDSETRIELSRFDMDSALLAVDFGNGVTKMPSNQIAL